jgi:hypothetical protein
MCRFQCGECGGRGYASVQGDFLRCGLSGVRVKDHVQLEVLMICIYLHVVARKII